MFELGFCVVACASLTDPILFYAGLESAVLSALTKWSTKPGPSGGGSFSLASSRRLVTKEMSKASAGDAGASLSQARLTLIKRRCSDIPIPWLSPFVWSRVGSGGQKSEVEASPSLMSCLSNALTPRLEVRVEDARAFKLHHRLRNEVMLQPVAYNGFADAIVTNSAAADGPHAAAILACLIVEWKTRTAFADATLLTQQRAQVQLELLSFGSATRRFVPIVLTDLATGMRVWDVQGSNLVEFTGSGERNALTLDEGLGLLVRLVERGVAETNAIVAKGDLQPLLPPNDEDHDSDAGGDAHADSDPPSDGGDDVGGGHPLPTAAAGVRRVGERGGRQGGAAGGAGNKSRGAALDCRDAALYEDVAVEERIFYFANLLRRSPLAQLHLNNC